MDCETPLGPGANIFLPMSKDIKAIETHYNGYIFRSRTEARTAVFFDSLGIKYHYEPEGFDLGNLGFYLPDFFLPQHDCYLEVKGTNPTEIEIEKCISLSNMTRKDVAIQPGPPDFMCWNLIYRERIFEFSDRRLSKVHLSNDEFDIINAIIHPIDDKYSPWFIAPGFEDKDGYFEENFVLPHWREAVYKSRKERF